MKIAACSPKIAVIMKINPLRAACATSGCHWINILRWLWDFIGHPIANKKNNKNNTHNIFRKPMKSCGFFGFFLDWSEKNPEVKKNNNCTFAVCWNSLAKVIWSFMLAARQGSRLSTVSASRSAALLAHSIQGGQKKTEAWLACPKAPARASSQRDNYSVLLQIQNSNFHSMESFTFLF